MILAFDIGNTYITMGCLGASGIILKEQVFTDLRKSAVEYAILFESVLEIYGVRKQEIQGGILSSSVPPVTGVVRHAAEKMLGKRVLEVGPGVKTGLDIKIDNPAQLGADLVVGAVAGIETYGAPLIIVDLGTATSFTVINEKRQVIGGMLMPGVRVSLEGMSMKTSFLPKISLEPPKKLIGSNTIDCMKSGIIYGTAACIDGMVDRIREELGCSVKIVATGGVAWRIIPWCREKIVMDDELLLRGLGLIYEKNSAGGKRDAEGDGGIRKSAKAGKKGCGGADGQRAGTLPEGPG